LKRAAKERSDLSSVRFRASGKPELEEIWAMSERSKRSNPFFVAWWPTIRIALVVLVVVVLASAAGNVVYHFAELRW